MRVLLDRERPLVSYLFELAGLPLDLEALRVVPLRDGDMGSLSIAPVGRSFGSSPAECHFCDDDSTVVSATLNLDESGLPMEIDVWRVDFKPLSRWPSRDELRAGPP